MPYIGSSDALLPSPTPNTSRPPLITSMSAASLASSTGLWRGRTSTETPMRAVVVCPASHARNESGWSVVGEPVTRSWVQRLA